MNTESPPDSSSRLVTVLVMVHGLAWAPFLLFMFLIAPRYQALFRDFEIRLPALTMLVLDWSAFIVGYTYLVAAALAGLLAVDWFVLHFLRKHSSTPLLGWLWFILLALVPLSSWACSWLSVWLPEVTPK